MGWCDTPAWRLAELIRRREVSPVEIVEAHIARIEAVNPQLNALIADRFAEARYEARGAEASVLTGAELPPLHGVPCTIKEFIAVRGQPWTAGLWARRERRAERDATTVSRLRAAGAIILGITNVPEGGMWMETYNPIYGRTNNPWDLERTPGGSSGGEAALVAAGGSPFGLGSDIAGSVRIPAGMCGVVAHKPTELLVPNTGHWGGSGSEAERMLCIGPLGRCVRDVEQVLELIAGRDGESRATGELAPPDADFDLRGVRVIPVTSTGRIRIAPVMSAAVDRVAASLAARGAHVEPLDRHAWQRLFGKSIGVWLRGLVDAGADTPFAQIITEGAPLSIIPELWRIASGRPRFALATLGLVGLERLSAPLERFLMKGVPSPAEIQAALEDVLGPRGVILHPPYSRPAPRHLRALATPLDPVCTALFSVTGLPATVVPVGFDANSLPVGIQIIARRGNDRLALAVARVVEDAFGGWTPAPSVR